jgi:uncharacterized protein involved in outer membrane biogenesis
MDQTSHPARPVTQHRHRGLKIAGAIASVLIAGIAALILLWNWDWFIPLVQTQASTALGRQVTIAHLHVHLGRNTTVAADDIVVSNPDKFQAPDPLARIGRLTIVASVMDYWHNRTVVLPSITVDRADIHATALPDGSNNFTIRPPAAKPGAKPAPPPQIGNLIINNGTARVIEPKLRADFASTIATRAGNNGQPTQIVVESRGTYAGQPVVSHFVGGALLSLRDAQHPYPIDIHVANGPTRASLVGTVQNPLNFAGAKLKLSFSGPDMAQLFPLTGIPLPQTPPFSIAGNLDYAPPRFRFTNFEGRVGNSDLGGEIDADPRAGTKPDVNMNLVSRRVDLADLGGFIGSPAGKAGVPGQTKSQKVAHAHAASSEKLFPSTPISLPKIRAADIHVHYRAEHIENKYTPFDKLVANLDIVDGKISLHPLDFGVGNGDIASNISLAPDANDLIHATADVRFRHIELARLMQATHTFKGRGIIGGEARLDTNGNSLASMMGQGNGELKLVLVSAGDLSALLVDIAGLEFGNAVLSALGVPERAKIDCFVTDLPMRQGIVDTKVFLLDTEEGRVTGTGTIDLRQQTLDYALTTRAKHFSVGSLPGPINLVGPITSPSIRPGAEVIARAGAATGLGILTGVGALLPTIQFGVGNDNACTKAEAAERQPLRAPAPGKRRAHK